MDINFSKMKRYDLIQKLVDKYDYKSYLEIGCYQNEVFDKIKCEKKVGVDPEMGGTLRMTSDEFFSNNTEKFDIIFIDGLHEYEQVKKDLINSMKVLNKNGRIIIHDMLPTRPEHVDMSRPIPEWTGDVWRLAFWIASQKNYDFTLLTMDYGCGVVRKGINKHPLNIEVENTWEFYENNVRRLPLKSPDNDYFMD